MRFFEEHGKLVGAFNEAKQEFIDTKYPAAIDAAEFRMGELFREEDYPKVDELRRKFYVNLDIDGIPQSMDVRLQNDEAIMQARITRAVGGLWERISAPLKHFADKMAGDTVFHATTLTNLQEIVAMLPELNFLEDPNLTAIGEQISKEIARYDIKDLRKDKDVRTALAGQAREILDTMAGFMNAFAGT